MKKISKLGLGIGEFISGRRERRLPLAASTYAEIVDDTANTSRGSTPLVNGKSVSDHSVPVGERFNPGTELETPFLLILSAYKSGLIDPEGCVDHLLNFYDAKSKEAVEQLTDALFADLRDRQGAKNIAQHSN